MKHLKAVIFDLDGTLVDSLSMLVAAKVHVADTHKLKRPNREEVLSHIRSSGSVNEVVAKLWPEEDASPLLETNKQFVSDNSHLSVAYEGVIELMEWLKDENLRIAAVTGASSKVHHLLKSLGIDGYFSSIVHADRVKNFKPDPEGVLLAASECGVQPEQAVMVGDMASDIKAGKRAGLHGTIGVTHGYDERVTLEKAGADILVDSLMDLPQAISTLDTN